MVLSFCSFSSGSSGNCYLIKSETTAILVDAGISAKRILAGLEHTDTTEEQLIALLVTHEHVDHIRSLSTMMKRRKKIEAYANEKTWLRLGETVEESRRKCFENSEPFEIGDITVKAFQVCHDAVDPVGYSFYSQGKQISIITDTGCIQEEMVKEVQDADLLVLEANHDVDMLKFSRYPWFLKQRILGDRGHLSNETAARMLLKIIAGCTKERCILLAHLSRENNFPEMAYQTVKNILEEENYYIGTHIELNTIVRDEISMTYQV
jgi:phosphoribosyl 1,2-cyclic phosphodiesterase